MGLIEGAIKTLAGQKVKLVLAKNTDRTVAGILTGTIATALLQSSSLVGLLVLAFVGARVMRLKQALLVIFGANLGTTATGWFVALIGFKLNLDAVSLPMIGIFGLLYAISNQRQVKNAGQLGLGIGLLLLALQFMKGAVDDLGTVFTPDMLSGYALWQYALFGIVASALVQSSSAVMVITLSAINAGMIDLHSGAALMIGADLGTTTTIIFGALGGSANKKRVAAGHVAFNLATDLIAFTFLYPLVAVVSFLNNDPLLSLVAFHSLFNVVGVLLWAPFAGQFANTLEKTFHTKSQKINWYLDPSTLEVDEFIVTALGNEVQHFAQIVVNQNSKLFNLNLERVPTKDEFRVSYRISKALEAEILEYALAAEAKTEEQSSNSIHSLLVATRNLLLSSKLCKDNLNDLRDIADYQKKLYQEVVVTQRKLYEKLESADPMVSLDPDQLNELSEQNNTRHDQLHQFIYQLIKADGLPANKVSTVLNLNRAIYNSNTVLIAGLTTMVQSLDMRSFPTNSNYKSVLIK